VIEVPIYKQFHKFVIGKGGANIRKVSMIVWPSVLMFLYMSPKWGVQYYIFMLHKQIWNCIPHFPVFSIFVMFHLKLVRYEKPVLLITVIFLLNPFICLGGMGCNIKFILFQKFLGP
jgi:hypothetical protein